MIYLKPKQISGEIMTLIEEADEKLIIISPYYNISKWHKLLGAFRIAKKKEIHVEFYVRDETDKKSFYEIKGIDCTPFEIPHLHTKLYLNEKYAIVSSMNLNVSSDVNSLDIGHKTETKKEYEELYDYYERYIKPYSFDIKKHGKNLQKDLKIIEVSPNTQAELYSFTDYLINSVGVDFSNWKKIVTDFIKSKFKSRYSKFYFKDLNLHFTTPISNFACYFGNYKKKTFFMIKIDLGSEYYSIISQNINSLKDETGAEIILGHSKQVFINYDQEIKSQDYNLIYNEDVSLMLKTISSALFLLAVIKKYIKPLKA